MKEILLSKCKKHIVILLAVFSFLFASGCAGTGEYLSDNEAIRQLKGIAGGEKLEISGKEMITEGRAHYEYTVESKDRNMTFSMNSYPAGEDSFYNPANIEVVQYIYAVHSIYEDDVKEELDELLGERNILVFKDRDELHEIALQLEKIDDIYKRELIYHNSEWLQKWPVTNVAISRRDDPDISGDFSYTINIDGSINAEDLEEAICDLYYERTGHDLQ